MSDGKLDTGVSDAWMPASGQRVYAADGRMGSFITKVDGGPFIVRPIFDTTDGYGDPTTEYADGLIEFDRIYANPPVSKVSREIVDLQEKAKALRGEIATLEAEKRDAERAKLDRAKTYAQHEALSMVDHFLAGTITHFVTTKQYGNAVQIKTFDQFMEDKSDYGRVRGMKLLSLFGDSKGNLTWQRSQYSDSSGSSWTYCRPCLSHEQALEIAGQEIEARWTEYRASTDKRIWSYSDTIKSAEAFGIAVPEDIRSDHHAYFEKALTGNVDKAREALAKAEEALADAMLAERAKGGGA